MRKLSSILVCGALACTAMTLPVSSAAAQPALAPASSVAAPAPVRLDGQGAPRVYSKSEALAVNARGGDSAVLGYWTPERMAEAVPEDVPVAPSASPIDPPPVSPTQPLTTSSLPVGPSVVLESPAERASGPVTNFSRTNGKMFYYNVSESRNSSCSAAAINSTSKRQIITSAHCLHSGKNGTFNQNVVFVPGFDGRNNPTAPVGRWQASTIRVSSEWVNTGGRFLSEETKEGFYRDIAFVTLFNGGTNNQPIVTTVGGHGFAYNGSYEFDATIFGYPDNNSFGNVMIACFGVTTRRPPNFPNRYLANCNFDTGASGGPWLANYSNATGLGTLRSVTSTTQGSDPLINGGVYFDDITNNMYLTSQTDA